MTQRLLLFLTLLPILFSCRKEEESSATEVDLRYSSVVSRFYRGGRITPWLRSPGRVYLQAHVYLPEGFASDIIVGLNTGFSEGNGDPLFWEGADWNSRLGITRDGRLWIAYGSDLALSGVPSDASNWETIPLGAEIKTKTWYRLRLECDFASRQFLSFTIQGPGLYRQIDLSSFPVDYTTNTAYDRRLLSLSLFALRNPGLAQPSRGVTTAFFDDLEAGLESAGRYRLLFRESFEEREPFLRPPEGLSALSVANFRQGRWYQENNQAIVTTSSEQAFSGDFSCLCDARLEGVKELGGRQSN